MSDRSVAAALLGAALALSGRVTKVIGDALLRRLGRPQREGGGGRPPLPSPDYS